METKANNFTTSEMILIKLLLLIFKIDIIRSFSTGSHNKKFEEKLFRFLFSYFV